MTLFSPMNTSHEPGGRPGGQTDGPIEAARLLSLVNRWSDNDLTTRGFEFPTMAIVLYLMTLPDFTLDCDADELAIRSGLAPSTAVRHAAILSSVEKVIVLDTSRPLLRLSLTESGIQLAENLSRSMRDIFQ